MKLTNARVASSYDDNFVREVTTLQDLESSSVSVITFWLDDHILNCKCLSRVKVCCPLVNVAESDRGK